MSGWKTYLFWLLAGIVTVLYSQGIIGETAYTFLIGIFVPAGAIAQRMATGRTEAKVDAAVVQTKIAAQASNEAAGAANAAKNAVSK